MSGVQTCALPIYVNVYVYVVCVCVCVCVRERERERERGRERESAYAHMHQCVCRAFVCVPDAKDGLIALPMQRYSCSKTLPHLTRVQDLLPLTSFGG